MSVHIIKEYKIKEENEKKIYKIEILGIMNILIEKEQHKK